LLKKVEKLEKMRKKSRKDTNVEKQRLDEARRELTKEYEMEKFGGPANKKETWYSIINLLNRRPSWIKKVYALQFKKIFKYEKETFFLRDGFITEIQSRKYESTRVFVPDARPGPTVKKVFVQNHRELESKSNSKTQEHRYFHSIHSTNDGGAKAIAKSSRLRIGNFNVHGRGIYSARPGAKDDTNNDSLYYTIYNYGYDRHRGDAASVAHRWFALQLSVTRYADRPTDGGGKSWIVTQSEQGDKSGPGTNVDTCLPLLMCRVDRTSLEKGAGRPLVPPIYALTGLDTSPKTDTELSIRACKDIKVMIIGPGYGFLKTPRQTKCIEDVFGRKNVLRLHRWYDAHSPHNCGCGFFEAG